MGIEKGAYNRKCVLEFKKTEMKNTQFFKMFKLRLVDTDYL